MAKFFTKRNKGGMQMLELFKRLKKSLCEGGSVILVDFDNIVGEAVDKLGLMEIYECCIKNQDCPFDCRALFRSLGFATANMIKGISDLMKTNDRVYLPMGIYSVWSTPNKPIENYSFSSLRGYCYLGIVLKTTEITPEKEKGDYLLKGFAEDLLSGRIKKEQFGYDKLSEVLKAKVDEIINLSRKGKIKPVIVSNDRRFGSLRKVEVIKFRFSFHNPDDQNSEKVYYSYNIYNKDGKYLLGFKAGYLPLSLVEPVLKKD